MWFPRLLTNLLLFPIRIISSIKQNQKKNPNFPQSILILWPKTNLGILLSCKLFFLRIKKSFPGIKISLVLRKATIKKIDTKELITFLGLSSNDEILTYSSPSLITEKYDVSITPSLDYFSTLSHLIIGLSRSEVKIGANFIDENINSFSFLFNYKSDLSWTKFPDIHISEFLTNQFTPFKDISSEIEDSVLGQKFEKQTENRNGKLTILLNNEPEEKSNRWSIESLLIFIRKIQKTYKCYFYFIEDEMEPDIKIILEKDVPVIEFINKNDIQKIFKLVKDCDLVISCSSDIMHLAGLTNVPQISIFGEENPFNIAPIGANKKFIKKTSNLISEITGDEVFEMSENLLKVEMKDEQ